MSSPTQVDEDEVEEEVEFVSVSNVFTLSFKGAIVTKDSIIS